jgi:hypothetical protein
LREEPEQVEKELIALNVELECGDGDGGDPKKKSHRVR